MRDRTIDYRLENSLEGSSEVCSLVMHVSINIRLEGSYRIQNDIESQILILPITR